jgi:phosphoribosylformylglycinamidine cyclo-ligase
MSADSPASALTYEAAGVSIAAQDAAIAGFAEAVTASHDAAAAAGAGHVIAGVGAFGAVFAPALVELVEPLLVSSTDGLGTKTLLHARYGTYELAGRDLVGAVINDVLCSGARPLFFLDYIGWHGLMPEQLAEVVRGVAAACAEAGCALVGGELAEMRDIYRAGDFDLTGTAVGVVDRRALLGPHRVTAGSALLGLASNGLHANGYSLVRQVLASMDSADWVLPVDTAAGIRALNEALLDPTRCYAGAMTALRKAGVELQAAAHISGGGMPGNVPRALPATCRAAITREHIPFQSVFATIQQRGSIDPDEMWRVFNMGCGFVLVAAQDQAGRALDVLNAAGFSAFRLGIVEDAVPGWPRFAWSE